MTLGNMREHGVRRILRQLSPAAAIVVAHALDSTGP
jgi:hypothetical protein